MFLVFVLYLSLGLVSPFSAVTAQNTGSSIGGNIMDTSRRPVSNIYIELRDDLESVLQRVRTDSSGRYTFNRLSRGNYYVRVVTAGTNFVSQSVRVELVVVSGVAGSGRTYEEVNLTLKTTDEEKGVRSKPVTPAGTVFSQNIPDEARKLYEDAVDQLDTKNNPQGGMEGLQKAVASFADYFAALERLGAEYVKRGQYAQAQETLAKAVKVNPKGNMSWYALGVAQYNQKNLMEAQESLLRSVTLAPNSAHAQFWYGVALFRGGKVQEAEPTFKKAYELGGKQIPADVHMYLAQIYSNSKRYKEAADELELFLKETDARDSEKIKGLIQQLRSKAGQ